MTINKTKTYKHNIGDNIRLWREFKGIKQQELASLIGKSKSTVSKIETNIEAPNVRLLEDIANALDLDVLQLYTSPQQQYAFNDCFNNSSNCNGINSGTQNVYLIEKDLLIKIISLIDKVTEKL